MKSKFLLLPWIALLSALLLSCSAAPVQQTESDTDTPTLTSALTTAETVPSSTVYTEEELQQIIDENLDILAAFEAPDTYMQSDIIDANPEAFQTIVDIGAAAIPYLLEIGQNPEALYDNTDQFRRYTALKAAYDIDPSLFDLSFLSPDGIHELRMPVLLFMTNPGTITENGFYGYGDPHIVNTETGAEIAYTSYNCFQPVVKWAPDGKSAAIFSYGESDTVLYLSCYGGYQVPEHMFQQQTGISVTSHGKDPGFLKWDENGGLYLEMSWECTDSLLPDTVRATLLFTPHGEMTVLDYEITQRQIQLEEVDHCLSNMPYVSLYGYENDLSASHALELLTGMGDAAIPPLLAIAEETRRYDSPGYDHQTFLKALLAIGIIDPTAYADLPIAEYLIPSEDGSYVWFEQEDLIVDSVGRRILCCSFLPFGDLLTAEYGIPVYRENTELELLSWESDTVIRLAFYVQSGEADIGSVTGELTYDISADSMLSVEYTTEFEPDTGPAPYDDISRDIAAQLDLLQQYGANAYSEQDCIDACPEAFDAILAYGEAALPYLTDVVENTPTRYYVRIALAQMAAHSISPALYAASIPSPDGQYLIRLLPQSFFGQYVAMVSRTYSSVCLLNASDGTPLAEENGILENPEVTWSSDSRYAVITHGHYRYGGGDPIVIDTQAGTISTVKDILGAVKAALSLESIELYSIHTAARLSESAENVCISFDIITHAASNPGYISGECYVNGTTGEIIETVIVEYLEPEMTQ